MVIDHLANVSFCSKFVEVIAPLLHFHHFIGEMMKSRTKKHQIALLIEHNIKKPIAQADIIYSMDRFVLTSVN